MRERRAWCNAAESAFFVFRQTGYRVKSRPYYEIKSKEECFMKDAFMKTFGGTMGVIAGFVAGITVSTKLASAVVRLQKAASEDTTRESDSKGKES